jgi:hypothetical protein
MPIQEKPQYENYQKMIANRARKWSQSFGVEQDELVCEGGLIFVLVVKKWKPGRGQFSTFLWRCLDNGLVSFCRQQKRQAFWDLDDSDALLNVGHNEHRMTERSIHIQQSIAMLPESTAHTMRLLMTAPQTLGLDGSEPPKVVRGALKRHLRACGESWSVTWQAMRDMKSIYQET